MDKQKQAQASHKLEEWSIAIPEIVRQLRQGISNPLAYALVYRLRWELTHILQELPGLEVPPMSDWTKAEEILESVRGNSERD